MEEALNSDSPSGLNRTTTELISTDSGVAVGGDQPSFEADLSTPRRRSEKPVLLALGVPSSKEERKAVETGPGNLLPGDQPHVCVLGEDMQETEDCALVVEKVGDSFYGAANEKGEKQSAGHNVEEMHESSGSEVLVATAGEVSEKLGSNSGVGGIGSDKENEAVGEDFGCSLEIELIDDTAVIGLSKIEIDSEMTGGKNGKKEMDVKKEKKPRRRSKTAKKGSEGNKNCSSFKISAGNSTGFKATEKGMKMVYSRKEMEALRYVNVKGQKRLWQEIYNTFSPSVKTEYDELGSFRHQNRQSGSSLDPHLAAGIIGIPAAEGGNCLDNYWGGGTCLDIYGGSGNCLNFYGGRGNLFPLNFYGGRGNCLNFYRQGGNCLNFYRGGNCLNFHVCGRFSTS